MRAFYLLYILALVLFGCDLKKSPERGRVPVADLFRNPDRVAYQLSPDGQWLAYLAPHAQRMNIFVQSTRSDSVRRVTDIEDRDIVSHGWAGNGHLYFLKDINGDENYYLSIVNITEGVVHELTRFEGVRTLIIDDLRNHKDEMLIAMNKRNPKIFDLYRLNLAEHTLTIELENPGNYSDYIVDESGKVRLVITTDGTNNGLLFRSTVTDTFKTVLNVDFKHAFEPVQFVAGQDTRVYALSNIGRNTKAAVVYDLETKEEIEVLFEHPEFDASWLLISETTQRPLLVSYTDWKGRYHILDDRVARLYERVRETISEDEITFVGADELEEQVLIRTYSDRTMGAYYLYDTNHDSLRLLADISPWLKKSEMAPVKPIQYKSRDGLTIHGYLTVPLGMKAKNLPVVVVPHGGPWMRDVWRFDRNVQFLANRGYAVFQMNFRGSTGYGRNFWEASFKEWGKAMQNDITDGVAYLKAEGIANPERIAIYGASYGGYAVLAGLAFTPDLYTCGIDYVGVSNLFTLMQTIPPYWEQGRQMFYEMIGHPHEDSLHYMEASPVFHAENIKVPLMVIQGAMDPRVKKAESDQIVEALAARGVEVDYILREDEGHGFRKEENRIELYEAIEEFLARHMGQ